MVEYLFNKIIGEKNEKMDMLKKLNVKFEKYKYKCEDSIINERYEKICQKKWEMYFSNPEDRGNPDILGVYKKEFKIPENWKTKLQTRLDFPCTFEYNLAHKTYNASLIFLDDNKFLAIEAPSSKNIKSFFELVDKYDISHFVKLNAPNEYSEDYYHFWEDRNTGEKDVLKFSKGNVKLLSYIWKNREAGNPEIICDMVEDIYKGNNGKIIAVSCRGGAGRTATFIAAYTLIKEIKNQNSQGIDISNVNISIDRILWEILLQRPYAIAFGTQYNNLYRIIDTYVSRHLEK